jgi:TatD DNase family protein
MLDLSKYNGKLSDAIAAARANDVGHILNVCVNSEDFPQVLQIAESFPDVTCTIGVHPAERNCYEPSVNELISLAQHSKVVAIGETGLDYFHCSGDLHWQRERFKRHIQAAKQSLKPLVVHSRQSSEDVLQCLREEKASEVGGVWHCFTETYEVARRVLDLGFYIGITGIVTFNKAVQLQEVAKRIPLNRLLLETDAPYLAPVPKRGKPNEPAFVRYIAEYVAHLREITYQEVVQQTTANFFALMQPGAN